MLVAIYRRYEGNRQFFDGEEGEGGGGGARAGGSEPEPDPDPKNQRLVKKFRTSGNSVALLSLLSLGAYVSLLVLTWKLV